MCELTVYATKGEQREKVMEGVVRLFPQNGTVLIENIFGESKEVKGRLGEVDITNQKADIVALSERKFKL
jgi:predicted RNA-binding protein